MRYHRQFFVTVLAAAAVLTACSSGPTAIPPAALPALQSAAAAAAGTTTADTTTPSGPGRAAIDPCQKISKADVQPFFTVPIATALPSPLSGQSALGCEWSAASGGGVPTSLDVLVIVGQDGADRWDLANQTGHPEKLTGIGDHAEHLAGLTDMWAITGTGANTIWCGVTTVGWKELAGVKDQADVATIPAAAATAIAEQFGLLCNRIFGSGNVSPTMTAPVPTGAAASATATKPTAAALAAGGVMPGTDVPIPTGMDCSGPKTAKDTTGGLDCTTTVTDTDGAYNFFLQDLPKAGYSVTHESYATATNGKIVASIGFSGGKYPGFNFINFVGSSVTLTLQLD